MQLGTRGNSAPLLDSALLLSAGHRRCRAAGAAPGPGPRAPADAAATGAGSSDGAELAAPSARAQARAVQSAVLPCGRPDTLPGSSPLTRASLHAGHPSARYTAAGPGRAGPGRATRLHPQLVAPQHLTDGPCERAQEHTLEPFPRLPRAYHVPAATSSDRPLAPSRSARSRAPSPRVPTPRGTPCAALLPPPSPASQPRMAQS